MALSKSITLAGTGITVDYWSITSADSILPDIAVNVYLDGYTSSTATMPVPAARRFFRLMVADIAGATDLHDVTTAQLYAAILAKVNVTPAAGVAADPLAGATSV
jgi:hypothetical protein